jgi:hypothetical protein
MRRSLSLVVGSLAAVVLVAVACPPIHAQKPAADQTTKERGTKQARKASRDAATSTRLVARGQFYAMQASLFSALAHARALEEITAEGTHEDASAPDYSLCRTLISIVSRSIQGTDTSSVALGQAIHSLEKSESMKTMRAELNAATKAADDAHEAADGHGAIRPHAKNVVAHLLMAMTALTELGDDADIKPMSPPGFDAMRNARHDK